MERCEQCDLGCTVACKREVMLAILRAPVTVTSWCTCEEKGHDPYEYGHGHWCPDRPLNYRH